MQKPKILRNSHIYIREDGRQNKIASEIMRYFIMIKGSLHLEDGIILNVYVHNTRTKTYRPEGRNKQVLRTVGDINTPQYLKRTSTLESPANTLGAALSTELMFIEHSNQQQQNKNFILPMKHLPGEPTC